MALCDLCHEYTTTDEHCSECGHRLRRIDPPTPEVPPPAQRFEPFGAAMAPLRARHCSVLPELTEWSLAIGRTCDLDMAALCLDVFEKWRTEDGIRLNRRDVTRILWGALHNAATMANTLLPECADEVLWTVLRFLVDTGRLTSDSDPEPALLEPLQCYGGLDADGHPRTDGVDVDFPCQCYLPHDPTCPPGMAQHIVGHAREDGTEFIVHAHLRLRSEDLPMSAYRPLVRLARRLRARRSYFDVAIDQFDLAGTVPAKGAVPKLWLYHFDPGRRRGFDPIVLDEHGHAWTTKRNRRYKAGYRWVSIDDRRAVEVCGLASYVFSQPPPGTYDDWDDDLDDVEDVEDVEDVDDGPLRAV